MHFHKFLDSVQDTTAVRQCLYRSRVQDDEKEAKFVSLWTSNASGKGRVDNMVTMGTARSE